MGSVSARVSHAPPSHFDDMQKSDLFSPRFVLEKKPCPLDFLA